MTLADDFNIYIGSSTGALKGVSLRKDKCTVKNIQNVRFLSNKASVLNLNWGSKEETEILIAYRGQKIKIYDVEFKNFNTNTDVSCGEGDIVGVSRYDECILTAVQSGDVKLWRYKTEGDQWTKFNVGANLERMKHNQESNVMATGGKENDLKLWDLNTTQNIFSAKNVKPDEFDLRRPVWVNDIAFLPNSDKVAVCSKQGYVRVYDPKVTTQRRPVLKIDVPDYAFSCLSTTNQNHYVLAGTTTGDMIAVDLRGKGKPCYKYKGFAGCVKSITCPQNENIILSVSLDRYFRVHDFHTKKLLRKDYMQSHLTSILIPSDFSLESQIKKTDEESQDREDEKYDPENYEMDFCAPSYRPSSDHEQEENNENDSGSDLEIIEEVVDSKNKNTNDSEEESEDDVEEEESGDDEYYTESEEDKEIIEEAESEDEESADEGENELFPLANTKKRKTSASKVGDIFMAAGNAFNKLADLTLQLHSTPDSPSGSQIKSNLKKKAFEDAGLPIQQQVTAPQQMVQQVVQAPPQLVQTPTRVVQQTVATVPVPVSAQQQLLSGSHKSAEVTLNMLNAHHESEVDVEGLPEEVKLQFDTSAQQVAN
ncbi:hypothetical protein WDU94_007824 [Cyamophila willieti]